MSRVPVVGVTPKYENGVACANEAYYELLRAAGLEPRLIPFDFPADGLAEMDGLLLTGGYDIDPACYGEAALPECGRLEPERDALELPLVREAWRLNLPTLGICRGIQAMNVALGGTLWQDLPSQVGSNVTHVDEARSREGAHTVTLTRGTPLWRQIDRDEIMVNTLHHQAVKSLAEGLEAMGTATDGVIEALYAPAKRCFLAVQWHPELLTYANEASRALLALFAAACRARTA